MIEEVYQQLKSNTVSFCLIACEIEDWNAQLSPWSAPCCIWGKKAFGEGSRDLGMAGEEYLPGLERHISDEAGREKRLLIGGYSFVWIICNVGFYELGIFAEPCSMFYFLLVRLDGVYRNSIWYVRRAEST